MELALRELARSDRFESELVRRLDREGMEDQAGAVLERLRQRGMVDDVRVALARARALAGRRFAGDAMVTADLERRGAGREAVAAAIASLPPETERAVEALGSRFSKSDPKPRAARWLASRGFGAESLERALDSFFGGAGG